MTHIATPNLDLRNPSISLDPTISGEYSFQLAAAQIAIASAVSKQAITGLDAREIGAAIKECTDAGGVHQILTARISTELVEAAKVEVARQAHDSGSTELSIPPRFRLDRLEALSTGGGKVTGFDFSGVADGIYMAGTSSGPRYLIVRGGEAQSFGGPSYDLSYLQRGSKDLGFAGMLDVAKLPSTRGRTTRGEQLNPADASTRG